MSTVIEEIIEDFTAGITDDPRRTDVGLSQFVSNFDIFSNKKRIIPYTDSESGDNASATSQKQAFDIGFWTPGPDWRLFSLGVKSGAGTAEVLMKTLGVGGSGDLGDATWNAPAANQSASGAVNFALWIYYKTTGKFYGLKGGNRVFSFTPDGSTVWNDNEQTLAYVNSAQGIIHSKDDILYVPTDNVISTNNNGTWANAVLTLPADRVITSIDEWQDYIIIAAAPLSAVGKTIMYLWDRDTSLTTLSESYDGGEGVVKVVANLGGDILSIAIANTASRLQNRVIFRQFAGTSFDKFAEFIAPPGSAIETLLPIRQRVDNRVYFMMVFTIDGVVREGLWSVGISKTGAFAISHERTPFNDTPISTVAVGGSMKGFFVIGDFKFIAYVDSGGGNYQLSKTNDQQSYIATAIYESTIKNKSDSGLFGKFKGMTVMFQPLPSGASVKAYYKKDSETGWTRVFVYTSQNSLSHSAVNLESDSNAFTVTIANPAVFTLANHGLIAGQIIKFLTTGALPTGVVAGQQYYVLSSGLTSSAFQVSATSGGSAVATTGTQSGVHTINRTVNLTQGKEFKFRVESTGGAVITGIKTAIEVIPNQPY